MTSVTNSNEGLRAWARGSYPAEAAVEFLIRACGGRFARPGKPWIRTTPEGRSWFDADQVTEDEIGYLSGGERRAVTFAAALVSERPIDLGDIAAGMGRENVDLALAALAHASGSHEHSEITTDEDGKPVGFARLSTLYPWPEG